MKDQGLHDFTRYKVPKHVKVERTIVFPRTENAARLRLRAGNMTPAPKCHNGADAEFSTQLDFCSETSMPALTIILTPPVSQSSLIFLSVTTDNAPAAPLISHHRHLVTWSQPPGHPSLIVFTRQLLTPGSTLPDTPDSGTLIG